MYNLNYPGTAGISHGKSGQWPRGLHHRVSHCQDLNQKSINLQRDRTGPQGKRRNLTSNTVEVLLLRALLKIVHQSDSLLIILRISIAATGFAEQVDRLLAGESLLGHQGRNGEDKEDEAGA